MLNSIFSESACASLGSFGASATCYRRAEDVRVIPIVVAPFEFGNIQRQIFAADFVEASHDATLQERPETIDCLGMDSAVNILTSAMPHGAVFFQLAVTGIFVGRDQADFFRDGFADETVQGFCIGMCDNARHYIAIAFDGTHNGVLAFAAGSWRALIPMPVFVLPADISFIDFDDTHELAEFRLGEPCADTMTHIESGRIGAKAKHAVHLQCRNALLAGQHQIDDLEPGPHRNIGVLEDRAYKHGKAITKRRTLATLPMKPPFVQFCKLFVPATRAANSFRPTARNQVGFASVISREKPIELRDGHLCGEFWSGHRSAPNV